MAGRIVEAIESVILGQIDAAANAATSFGEDAVALLPQKITLTGNEGSQSIIDADPDSLGIVIGVPSAQDKNVFLAFGSPAVMQAGISLVAGERPLLFLSALSALELFAISNPNGATISWQQFVKA